MYSPVKQVNQSFIYSFIISYIYSIDWLIDFNHFKMKIAGISLFTQLNNNWVYDKTENLKIQVSN